MNRSLTLFSLVFLWVTHSIAADVVWIELDPKLRYRDVFQACVVYNSVGGHIYFVGEIEDGEISKAKFQRNPWPNKYYLKLTEEEIAKINLVKNEAGEYLFSSFDLNARQLNWIAFHSDSQFMGCKPSAPLATLNPNSQFYEFKWEEVGPNKKLVSKTTEVLFKGRLKIKSEHNYEMKLGFVQRPFFGAN